MQVPRLGLRGPRQQVAQGGARLPPLRQERPGARGRPISARAWREYVQGQFRGDHRQPGAALPGVGVGLHQGRDREVHGHQTLPDLWREAVAARDPRGHDRRAQRLGHLDPVDQGCIALGRRPRAVPDRAGADDRGPAAQGDRGPARIPGRRRPGLPDPGPDQRDTVGRRGATDPPRDADRDDLDGRPVHPR